MYLCIPTSNKKVIDSITNHKFLEREVDIDETTSDTSNFFLQKFFTGCAFALTKDRFLFPTTKFLESLYVIVLLFRVKREM